VVLCNAPLRSFVGPLRSFAVLCGPLRSFAVFSHTRFTVGMFTVNRLTENFRLTSLSINRTETGNMATSKKAVI